jgi:hypothetical protein
MDTLHKHHYDLALATCSLVPNTGPILVKDQMEDWSAAEANSFEDAIEKCGKDFIEIQKEYVNKYIFISIKFNLLIYLVIMEKFKRYY